MTTLETFIKITSSNSHVCDTANLLIGKIHNPKYIKNGLFWLFLEIFSSFTRWSYRCQMRQCCILYDTNLTSFFQMHVLTQNTLINGLFWLYLELFLPFHHGDGQSRWCYRCQMRRCCTLYDTLIWQVFSGARTQNTLNGLVWQYLELF